MTPAAANPGWRRHVGDGGGFVRAILAACLFLTYPLALLAPVGALVPLVFHVNLPTTMWLGLLAVSYLMCTPFQNHGTPAGSRQGAGISGGPALQLLFLAVVFTAALSAWHGRTALVDEFFAATATFALPLFFATCPRHLLPRRPVRLLGLLWLANAAHAAWQWGVPFEAVGIVGNRNWQAAMTAALAPWACLWARELCRRKPGPAGPVKRFLHSLPWSILVAAVSLWLVWLGASRAVWLMLLMYAFGRLVLGRFSKGAAALLVVLLAFLGGSAALIHPQPLAQAVRQDIRLPLWTETVRLIRDRPWLGTGPGNFRRDFAAYRSDAHRQRDVAAPVTEHPHNEALNIAATLGLPLLAVWIALLTPLFRRPRRQGVFWQASHYSAIIIFGAAMFDKALVQAPLNLLGLFFLGLLWRPRLRLRARPARRPAVLRLLWRPVAAAALLFGLVQGWREVARTSLLRSGMIAEEEKSPDLAFSAYAEAAWRFPAHVHPAFFAGSIAAVKLREPATALPFFASVRKIEPDFAHVNGGIGLALGMLGHHREALPYFERNARLHSFDVEAAQHLFMCRLAASEPAGIFELNERLARLRLRQCRLRLGEGKMDETAVDFLRALQRCRQDDAVAAATAITAPLDLGYAEPDFLEPRDAAGLPEDLPFRAFGTADFRHWRRALLLHRLARQLPDHSPPTLLRACRAAAGPTSSAELRELTSILGAAEVLAEIALQAGWHAVLVAGRDVTDGRFVELRRGADVWLVDLELNQAGRGSAAAAGLGEIELLLIAAPADFCVRTQALGQIVRLLLHDSAPAVGLSPSLRRLHYSGLLQAEAAARQPTAKPSALNYSPMPFKRLAAELAAAAPGGN